VRIAGGSAIPIRIPLNEPFRIASGSLTHSNHVLVRLVDRDGRVGWGETTTFLEVYGYDQDGLAHMVEAHFIPAVVGMDPRDPRSLHERLERVAPFNRMAKAGIDLAAHDLWARAEGVPLHRLLGGRRVERVPLTGVIDLLPPAEAAAAAAHRVSSGFATLKIKIGSDPQDDLRRVAAVREAVGPRVRLRVDGNCGYDLASALAVLPRLEEFSLEWIEQPLPRWDLEGMARLARRLRTPLAVDESAASVHGVRRAIEAGAAAVVNVKLAKCGGLFPCREIAALCLSAGVRCVLGGCLEAATGTAAGLHLYASTPPLESAAEIGGPWLYGDDVAARLPEAVAGAMALPEGPGIGVEPDEGKIALYRPRRREP